MSEPIFRPLPDVVDWCANREACTITLALSENAMQAWMNALDAGGLYRVASYGDIDKNLSDGHAMPDPGGRIY